MDDSLEFKRAELVTAITAAGKAVPESITMIRRAVSAALDAAIEIEKLHQQSLRDHFTSGSDVLTVLQYLPFPTEIVGMQLESIRELLDKKMRELQTIRAQSQLLHQRLDYQRSGLMQ